MTDPRIDHLDPATIAALVDRTLDPAARAAAEVHLAACADCREVWVETSEMAEGMTDTTLTDAATAPVNIVAPRLRSRRWIYGGAGLAMAAALALVVFSPRLFDAGDRPELRELVEAVGENRRTEARLTGGFEWGPVPSVTRGADQNRATAVDLAVAHLISKRAKSADARMIAATGVGHLMAGAIDLAISELHRASTIDSTDAMIWSDLAGAYLEHARLTGDAGAPREALRAADRAVAIEPMLPEALFNRALALATLNQRSAERAAWNQYLAIDGASPWAAEARRRRDVARPPLE